MFCTVRLQYQQPVSPSLIWDDSHNPKQPQHTGLTEGDSTSPPHTSPSYPIASNPSVNRKQWNDRSWSDQGSAPTPNNPVPPEQTSRLWVSFTHSMAHSFPGNYWDLHTVFLLFHIYLYSTGLDFFTQFILKVNKWSYKEKRFNFKN